jgi:G3E family GTPase
MRLVVMTGFLGSGKTTLMLNLVHSLISRDVRNLVIIENEVGEIGIDGAYLERQGLKVKELYSGCVCCQLAGDLVTTLKELKAVLDPDFVFLEASGMARLENIMNTLDKYCDEIGRDDILTISVTDAERSGMLLENPMPVIANQIKLADLVALNKTDTREDKEVDGMIGMIHDINPHADIVAMSAMLGGGVDTIAERIALWI